MTPKTGLRILGSAARGFIADNVPMLAAALAFYTALSLAPLLIIFISVTGYLGRAAQERILQEVLVLAGPQFRDVIRLILENAAATPATGLLSGSAGIVAVLLSATIAFAHLHRSLNLIWKYQPHSAPRISREVLTWLRARALSLFVMLGIGLLLLVAIAGNAALSLLPPLGGDVWQSVDRGGRLLMHMLLFGLLFKVLTDARVEWREVFFGALGTAGLFMIGNWAIGSYLRYAGIGTAYGAAGSLFILLVWVYYTAVIILIGAELTAAYATHRRRR